MELAEFARDGLDELLRFAHALAGDRGTAEDICQEVLIRLFVSPKRPSNVANVPAYARRMVVNEYLSWGRKWFRVHPTEEISGQGSSPDFAPSFIEAYALRRELAALPRKQRAAVVLRFYDDMTDTDIADLLGCSVSTVRSHISRALSSLRIDMSQPAPENAEAR